MKPAHFWADEHTLNMNFKPFEPGLTDFGHRRALTILAVAEPFEKHLEYFKMWKKEQYVFL